MAAVTIGAQIERLTHAQAQALLQADLVCNELGLRFPLHCARCGLAWGSERTRMRNGRVTHYEIVCECKQRVYDAIDEM